MSEPKVRTSTAAWAVALGISILFIAFVLWSSTPPRADWKTKVRPNEDKMCSAILHQLNADKVEMFFGPTEAGRASFLERRIGKNWLGMQQLQCRHKTSQ